MEMDLSLNIEAKQTNPGTIIILDGVLTNTTVPILKEFLEFSVSQNSMIPLAFNLEKLKYIDAKGLGFLKDTLQKLSKQNIPLYAFGMPDEIRTIFEMVDIGEELKFVTGENDIMDVS